MGPQWPSNDRKYIRKSSKLKQAVLPMPIYLLASMFDKNSQHHPHLDWQPFFHDCILETEAKCKVIIKYYHQDQKYHTFHYYCSIFVLLSTSFDWNQPVEQSLLGPEVVSQARLWCFYTIRIIMARVDLEPATAINKIPNFVHGAIFQKCNQIMRVVCVNSNVYLKWNEGVLVTRAWLWPALALGATATRYQSKSIKNLLISLPGT